jgi:hypothetical protein
VEASCACGTSAPASNPFAANSVRTTSRFAISYTQSSPMNTITALGHTSGPIRPPVSASMRVTAQ